jgi:hypothetical protein
MKMPSGFGACFPFYHKVKMLCGADYSNSMQRLANERKYIVSVIDLFSSLLRMQRVLRPLPLVPRAPASLRALPDEMRSVNCVLSSFPVLIAKWPRYAPAR